MLRSVKDLGGYAIRAVDGDIGKVHEFYFDDRGWIIRYLVVDTGTWLPGRRLLLSPAALGQPDWETHVLPVGLTKGQVEHLRAEHDIDMPDADLIMEGKMKEDPLEMVDPAVTLVVERLTKALNIIPVERPETQKPSIGRTPSS